MGWESLSEAERSSRLGGVKVDLSVQTERVRDGQYLCSSLDLSRVGGIEAAFQDGSLMRTIPIEEFLDIAYIEVSSFAVDLHRTNEHILSIWVHSALTFVRQFIGWSGKIMGQQLRAAWTWRDAERR